jgi:UV DNA damage repair endonuclease
MSLPLSLKKTEQDVRNELAQSNLKVNFQIINYQKENADVQYRLSSNRMPLQCTVIQAKEIADKHIQKWKNNPN